MRERAVTIRRARREALSLTGRLLALPPAKQAWVVKRLSKADLEALDLDWIAMARPGQMWPDPAAAMWMMLAGRGYGKTRAGSEWVRHVAETVIDARIALVGATEADVRKVMIEGASGLMTLAEPMFRPTYYPSRGELKWSATGAVATVYSAEAANSLRGPEHHAAWGDEFAKWTRGEEALANLRMGLRLGDAPKLLLTTTPKPSRMLAGLITDPAMTVTRGSTFDNDVLPQSFLDAMHRDYGGTRRGRQELDGEYLEDVEGALFVRGWFEAGRVRQPPCALTRTVIGVDPEAGGGAECGIAVTAKGADGRAYVLEDASMAPRSPADWARAVRAAHDRYAADRIVVEINMGGAMVAEVLEAGGARLPLKTVTATASKARRAEPVSSLYERGLVAHVGVFPELEDQLAGFTMGGGYEGGGSPDRADALVWALTELMLGAKTAGPKVRVL
ncbi:MAG: terminase family protein [Pacificimonas sp.]